MKNISVKLPVLLAAVSLVSNELMKKLRLLTRCSCPTSSWPALRSQWGDSHPRPRICRWPDGFMESVEIYVKCGNSQALPALE